MSELTPTTVTEPIDAEIVTLTCECGHAVTGPARGRGSATWKMGTHRYVKHGESKRTGSKAKTDATAEAVGARPVLGVVRDIAEGVGRGTGAPSVDDIAKAGGRGLTWITLGVASLVVESDPRIPETPEGDKYRDDTIETLTLPEKAGADALRPVARMLAPTSLNRKYGRGIVDNVDVLGSAVEILAFARGWSRYLRDRRAGVAELQPAPALYSPPYGHVPSAADLEGITSAPPQSGHVMSAEDVAALQAQRGMN